MSAYVADLHRGCKTRPIVDVLPASEEHMEFCVRTKGGSCAAHSCECSVLSRVLERPGVSFIHSMKTVLLLGHHHIAIRRNHNN